MWDSRFFKQLVEFLALFDTRSPYQKGHSLFMKRDYLRTNGVKLFFFAFENQIIVILADIWDISRD